MNKIKNNNFVLNFLFIMLKARHEKRKRKIGTFWYFYLYKKRKNYVLKSTDNTVYKYQ